MSKCPRERIIYTHDGKTIRVVKDFAPCEPEQLDPATGEWRVLKICAVPLTPAIHEGKFPRSKPRYISGLARYTGDPTAMCDSVVQVEKKAHERGLVAIRPDDAVGEHPIHKETGRGWTPKTPR